MKVCNYRVLSTIILSAGIAIFSACSNPSSGSPPVSFIYFGGNQSYGTGTAANAKIWKVAKDDYSNISETILTGGTTFMTVKDMVLVDGTIYSLVKNGVSPYSLYLYKGEAKVAEISAEKAVTGVTGESMAIKDGVAYIFCIQKNSEFCLYTITADATITKHIVYALTESRTYPQAEGVLIDGDVIYLTGYYGKEFIDSSYYHYPFLWRGSISNLSAGFIQYPITDGGSVASATVEDITINDGALYIAGSLLVGSYNKATYWSMHTSNPSDITTVTLPTSKDSGLTKVITSSSNIHAIGFQNTNNDNTHQLLYWLNGTATTLNEDGDFCALYDLCLDDGRVYLAGYDTDEAITRNDIARFWEGQTAYDLSDGNKDAVIQCIVAE